MAALSFSVRQSRLIKNAIVRLASSCEQALNIAAKHGLRGDPEAAAAWRRTAADFSGRAFEWSAELQYQQLGERP